MTNSAPQPVSPDGNWVWDGHQWQPNPALTPLAPPAVTPFQGAAWASHSTSYAPVTHHDGPPNVAPARQVSYDVPPASPYVGPLPPGAAGGPATDDSFAWALAATPVLGLVVSVIFAVRGLSSPVAFWALILAAVVVGVALAIADAFRLRAAGVRVSVTLAILLVPLYLFLRSSRVRRGFAIPLAWCAAFALSAAGLFVVPQVVGVPIDAQAVQRSISTGIRQQAGIAVIVECPTAISVRPGEMFQCTATADDQSVATVDVTLQNTDGAVWWEVRDEGSVPEASGDQDGQPASGSGDAAPEAPADEPQVARPITPASVRASSSAADSVDSAGSAVTFGPENAVDGVSETAWRPVEGDGVGQTFTLELGVTSTITSVGLVPGYDKVDSLTGQDRFLQNRRIEEVRWVFDDGSSVVQRFADDSSLQTTAVLVVTSTIRFEILATRTGQGSDPRNFAPVSEVEVWGSQ